MKIAAYTIAKNEAKNVDRWMKSVLPADVIVFCDTGSDDGTFDAAERWRHELPGKISVHRLTVRPWRFDDARNAALALVPADVDACVVMDLDDEIQPGWRTALEVVWRGGVNRIRYPYTFNWNPDGTPKTVYYSDRIHARHGFRWKHPVHEIVVPSDGDRSIIADTITVHQRGDVDKDRSGYLSLLQMAVKEDPHSDRNSHYLGREWFFRGEWRNGIAELERHLSLPSATWKPERAASMRMLAKMTAAIGDRTGAEAWYWRAIFEAPEFREGWVDATKFYHQSKDWFIAHHLALKALEITVPPTTHILEWDCYRGLPDDLLSISAWHLGFKGEAVKRVMAALEWSPTDDRLSANLKFMTGDAGISK